MIKTKYSLLAIVIGFLIALMSSYINEAKSIFLTIGIVIMLFGLFKISSNIPSKNNNSHEKIEDEEE